MKPRPRTRPGDSQLAVSDTVRSCANPPECLLARVDTRTPTTGQAPGVVTLRACCRRGPHPALPAARRLSKSRCTRPERRSAWTSPGQPVPAPELPVAPLWAAMLPRTDRQAPSPARAALQGGPSAWAMPSPVAPLGFAIGHSRAQVLGTWALRLLLRGPRWPVFVQLPWGLGAWRSVVTHVLMCLLGANTFTRF